MKKLFEATILIECEQEATKYIAQSVCDGLEEPTAVKHISIKDGNLAKIADKFTDTFAEQITNYLIAYSIDATEANIDGVIKEIVRIYTSGSFYNKYTE